MKTAVLAAALLVLGSSSAQAYVFQFGNGGNQFSMNYTQIYSPANAADTTGAPNPAGAVPYLYHMGTYEVSRDMVTKANTVGGLLITLDDMSAVGGNGPNQPATGVTWNEAARFVNWLSVSNGFSPAYKFTTQPGDAGYVSANNSNITLWTSGDAGFNPANRYRNSQAVFFLPSVDEWYKAAYYDPVSGTYSDFATGSNTAPTSVASGTAPGTAVYGSQTAPAAINLAGGLSFYGTMGQNGNVYEVEETDQDLVNDGDGANRRGARGGSWAASSSQLSSLDRTFVTTGSGLNFVGFRVASVASIPEASPILLGSVLMLVVGCWKRVGR